MIEGILLIDKPKGITSYDVIRKTKKDYPKGTKIGHTGTLDPFATGLLILLIGRSATKLMDKFHKLKKRYVVDAEFGFETDTQDVTGKIVAQADDEIVPKKKDIESMIKESFLGMIKQVPPNYSAKKIDGKRAYNLARSGEKFDLEAKNVEIFEFKVMDYQFPNIKLEILCSTGTYIRTLVKDLGRELGTYATAIELRRVQIGRFRIEDANGSIIEVDKVLKMLNE
ncbi:MAG: tRNA pseudouridine(55) synthase TruB [Candidatus Dojkabacteria bacterium]|jgi:tRNA pseudouridine55 synthase|nr:tRNA pseudouridine(55) synthase TruB [Candidatus Dojkabacteria bacterium]MDD2270014.1 tRNA pseudouridine(55) synthase TruB [Candidatus Dojkabacteria bacterium]